MTFGGGHGSYANPTSTFGDLYTTLYLRQAIVFCVGADGQYLTRRETLDAGLKGRMLGTLRSGERHRHLKSPHWLS